MTPCNSEHCVTCADEAIPMTVVRVDPVRGLALCADADGERVTVDVALIGSVGVGARVLVHAGTALAALG